MTDEKKFLALCTSLALRRGGVSLCGEAIVALDDVLKRGRIGSGGDDLARLVDPARALVEARLASDPARYDQARHVLSVALARFWTIKANQ